MELLEIPGRRRVIAKLVQKNSIELSILQELSSPKLPHHRSPHNRVIPLLRTVTCLDSKLYIILPSMNELSMPTFGAVPRFEQVRLSHELVEGVAFLHRLGIAHLDIKPDNLVCDWKTRRLHIIDFDTAVRCRDADEMVELSCGTSGWSAPEVVLDDKKPLRAFNPIRADLWSCGKVLQSLGMGTWTGIDGDPSIDWLTRKLVSLDPRRRPLLHDIVVEEQDFWTTSWPGVFRSLTAPGKVQEATRAHNAIKLKRARNNDGHANGLGSPPKILRSGVCSASTPVQLVFESNPVHV